MGHRVVQVAPQSESMAEAGEQLYVIRRFDLDEDVLRSVAELQGKRVVYS